MNSKSTHKLTITVVCLLCLAIFSCSVFAETLPDNTSSYYHNFNITDTDNNVVGILSYDLNVLDSYIADISYDSDLMLSPKTLVPYTSSTGSTLYRVQSTTFGGQSLQGYESWNNTSRAYVYCTPINVVFYLYNNSNKFININSQIRTTLNITTTSNDVPIDIGYDSDVGNVHSNDIHVSLYNDYVYFSFGNQFKRADSNSFWLTPYSASVCSFTLYIYHSYTSTYNINPCVFKAQSVEVRTTDITNRTVSDYIPMYNDSLNILNSSKGISTISSKLDTIINNYNSANNTYDDSQGQQIKDDSESKAQTIETIHESESQYYNQNKQAIEDTGLTNFNYSPEQISSFSVLITDFNNLWNSLDGWTFVYTFSLMLSLALLIIRHKPMTRDKGDSKDA